MGEYVLIAQNAVIETTREAFGEPTDTKPVSCVNNQYVNEHYLCFILGLAQTKKTRLFGVGLVLMF